MSEKDDLNRAYALRTPEDSRKLYGDWAETYDSDFVDERGYILHLNVAQAFVAAGGTGPVLDLGAGTGICGAALARNGIKNIHATDIAPEMLAQAKAKNVYARCFEGNILDGLDIPDGTYHGLVSSGTFTCGHVGPNGLDEVARLLAPGALAVISVRDIHFETAGFAAKIATLEPYLALTDQPIARIYAQGSQGEHGDDLALLLHLRRR